MKKKISVILIGAGGRGNTYTNYLLRHADDYELVAVAEPSEYRRKKIQEKHSIPDELAFDDWRPLLAKGRIADACFICTMDRDHFAPATEAIDLGYEILLEKPAGATPEECMRLAERAEEKGTNVLVCHVLRYTPFFIALKNLIDQGKVGQIKQIQHREDVGNVHFSHSFLRGNWGNESRATPMILQKSCHDMDILQWLIGKPCTRVHSFGSLTYFTHENRPAGAPQRCIDGCPVGDTCPYNATKLYSREKNSGWYWIHAHEKHGDATEEELMEMIRTTNYGKCVFAMDNDVVDHQVVNLQFGEDTYVTFSMAAFNRGGRELTVMGTKGTLHAKMSDGFFTHFDFETRTTTQISIESAITAEHIDSGHGGGDDGILDAFFARIRGEYQGKSICSLREAAQNHLIAFAAEESRHNSCVVDMKDYEKRILSSL